MHIIVYLTQAERTVISIIIKRHDFMDKCHYALLERISCIESRFLHSYTI